MGKEKLIEILRMSEVAKSRVCQQEIAGISAVWDGKRG
jgi:hypothetical protein